MADNKELYDTEKRIRDSLREDAFRSAPPFEGIAGRIAMGEPRESFEAFFGGGLAPSGQTTGADSVTVTRSGSRFRWKILAGIAAAFLLFVGGAAAFGSVLNGSMTKAESAADARMYYDSLENGEMKSLENGAAEDCENPDESVSDSDLSREDDSDSSGSD